MYEMLNTFLESQTFGIILGAMLTGGFAWFIEWRKSIIENRNRLCDKREELYEQMYDFVMRYEKDARTYKSQKYISEDTRDFYNEIEKKTIWASTEISNQFYTLFSEIMQNAKSYKKHWEKILDKNREKILNFKDQIRKELGIKD